MQPNVLFAIASCCVALAQGAQLMREKTLEYQSGFLGSPNWQGSLYCPMDYGINIETIRIEKPCLGIHCYRLVPYKPTNTDNIHAKCKTQNTCDVKIWQKSYTDGNDIVIGYSCWSQLEHKLFAKKMVKRVYSENDVSVTTYCNEGRVRRGADDIALNWPQYSFDDAIAARELLARAGVRGYTIEERHPTTDNVIRTLIRRTRRHADGNDITLPVYLAANLTLWSMQPSSERGPFSPYVNDYLTRSGIRRGDNNADDGGHLVAYTLGGGDSPANLVPMARDLNRRQGIWYRHEEEVRSFLRRHTNGMVSWEVLVVYSVSSEEPYRPVSFMLRYITYEDVHNLNNGVPRIETFINENEHYRNNQCTFELSDFFAPDHQQNPDSD